MIFSLDTLWQLAGWLFTAGVIVLFVALGCFLTIFLNELKDQ